MENYIKALFDFTKLPTKIFVLFAIASSFILFFDHRLLSDVLFLNSLKAQYGWIVGLVFLISVSFSLLNFFIWIINSITNSFAGKKRIRYLKKQLAQLDTFEQAVLREFALQGKKSIDMPMDDATVGGLLSRGILVHNLQLGNSYIMNGMTVSLRINYLVEEFFRPEYIGLSNPPTEEQKRLALKNRPSWVNNGYY